MSQTKTYPLEWERHQIEPNQEDRKVHETLSNNEIKAQPYKKKWPEDGKKDKSRLTAAKGDPIVVLNHLNSSDHDILTMVEQVLTKNEFSDNSSIHVVVPSVDNDAGDSSDDQISTTCIQISTNAAWKNKVNTVELDTKQRRNSSATHQGVRISSKGKKFFMEGLPKEIISLHNKETMPQYIDQMAKNREIKTTKNKLCQINTPNEIVTRLEQNFVGMDTTADRPCCCDPKTQYSDYNIYDRYEANVMSNLFSSIKQDIELGINRQEATFEKTKPIAPGLIYPSKHPCAQHQANSAQHNAKPAQHDSNPAHCHTNPAKYYSNLADHYSNLADHYTSPSQYHYNPAQWLTNDGYPLQIQTNSSHSDAYSAKHFVNACPAQERTNYAQNRSNACPAQDITNLAQRANACCPTPERTNLAQRANACYPAPEKTNLTQRGNACCPAPERTNRKGKNPVKNHSNTFSNQETTNPANYQASTCSAQERINSIMQACQCSPEMMLELLKIAVKGGTLPNRPTICCEESAKLPEIQVEITPICKSPPPEGMPKETEETKQTQATFKQTRFNTAVTVGTSTEPKLLRWFKNGMKWKKFVCECPETEPKPELDLNPETYLTLDSYFQTKEDIMKKNSLETERVSGFKINQKKKKVVVPSEFTIEDALRYYAMMKPDLFQSILQEQQTKLYGTATSPPFEPTSDSEAAAAATDSQDEEGPFRGLKFKIGGKGSSSQGLAGICCFDLLQESFTTW